jgi:hypothetical protein
LPEKRSISQELRSMEFVSCDSNYSHLMPSHYSVEATDEKTLPPEVSDRAQASAVSVRIAQYRRADKSRPVSFTVSPWERVLSRLQRETSKWHVGEAHSVLITAILLPQRLSCCCDKAVSLRMLSNLRLGDLRPATAQQRTTGQNLTSGLYVQRTRIGSYLLPSARLITGFTFCSVLYLNWPDGISIFA